MELRLLGIALILAGLARGESAPSIGVMRHAYLQDGTPYEVGLGALPTTILMPGPIEAFEGEGITNLPGTAAAVFLQHKPGTNFFSVKQLIPGPADLNVVLNNSLYSFHFTYAPSAPTRTLVISPVPTATIAEAPALHLTARRLYEIVQEARTYRTIQEQHPELIRPIEFSAPGTLIPFNGYAVVLDQVFRFETDDTLVFRVVLLNDGTTPLSYSAAETALRVGNNLYWPSFAQLGGTIPARNPASLAFATSPDVEQVTLTAPDGTKTEVITSPLKLAASGRYLLTARNAQGQVDQAEFTVKYPLPPSESPTLKLAADPHAFGIRDLTLTQPTPGQAFGYVCYSGSADGQRANISIKQDFAVLLNAKATP